MCTHERLAATLRAAFFSSHWDNTRLSNCPTWRRIVRPPKALPMPGPRRARTGRLEEIGAPAPAGAQGKGHISMDDKILAAAQLWKDNLTEADLAAELDELMAAEDPEKLSDAFYRSLSFGTAGLRGTLGVGTNRMNIYTVSQATQGLATYLNAHYEHLSLIHI